MKKSEQLESNMNRLLHQLLLENYEELFFSLHVVLSLSNDVIKIEDYSNKRVFIEMMMYIYTHHQTERMVRFRKNVQNEIGSNSIDIWWENQKSDLGLN